MKKTRKEIEEFGLEEVLKRFCEGIEVNVIWNEDHIKPFIDSITKPTIEVGKVYKNSHDAIFIYLGERVDQYGIDVNGNWFDNGFYHVDSYCTEATHEEWEAALIKEAKRKGFDKRQSKCLVSSYRCPIVFEDLKISLVNDSLWTTDTNGHGNCIMKDGIWADFIEEEKEESELKKCWSIELDYDSSIKEIVDAIKELQNNTINELKNRIK